MRSYLTNSITGKNVIFSGESVNILVNSNMAMTANTTVYDKAVNKLFSTTQNANSVYAYTPPAGDYGNYTVTSVIGSSISRTWFYVADRSSLTTLSLPYTWASGNIQYTLSSSYVLTASYNGEQITINWFNNLRSYYTTMTVTANPSSIDIHMSRTGSNIADFWILNTNFGLIFRLKGIAGASITCLVPLTATGSPSYRINQLSTSGLVYDWNDILTRSTGILASSINKITGVLTVALSTSFDLEDQIFTSGFESGSFAGDSWTSSEGTAAVQTTIKNTGTYAMSAGTTYGIAVKSIVAQTTLYVRAYVYLTALPTSGYGVNLMEAYPIASPNVPDIVFGIHNWAGTEKWGITYSSAYSITEADYFAATPNPVINTWYCIELNVVVVAGVSNAWTFYVDGVNLKTKTVVDVNSAAVDTVRLQMSPDRDADGITAYIDDVVIDTAYIGPLVPAPENYYVDTQSNVDGVVDVGTHSTFNNQKAVDSTYDTLTEADTAGTTTSTVLSDGFEANNFNNWDGNGATTWTNDGGICTNSSNLEGWASTSHSGTYYAGTGATGDGELETDNLDLSGVVSFGVRFWYAVDDTDGANELVLNYWDGANYDKIADLSNGAEDTWRFYSAIITDNQYFDATFRLQFIAAAGSGEAVYIDDFLINKTVANTANYRLSLEEEFTSCNYTRTNEQLCIKMGAYSNGETLSVQWWNSTSSSWTTIIASLTASDWTNVTVTSYLTSSVFVIQFIDGTISSDAVQSTWQKDATLLHTWSTNSYSAALTQAVSFAQSVAVVSAFNSAVSRTFSMALSTARVWTAQAGVSLSVGSTWAAGAIQGYKVSLSQAINYASTLAVAGTWNIATSLAIGSTWGIGSILGYNVGLSLDQVLASSVEIQSTFNTAITQDFLVDPAASVASTFLVAVSQSVTSTLASGVASTFGTAVSQDFSLSSLASTASTLGVAASQGLDFTTLSSVASTLSSDLSLSAVTGWVSSVESAFNSALTQDFSFISSVESILTPFLPGVEYFADLTQGIVSGFSMAVESGFNSELSETFTFISSVASSLFFGGGGGGGGPYNAQYYADLTQALGFAFTSSFGYIVDLTQTITVLPILVDFFLPVSGSGLVSPSVIILMGLTGVALLLVWTIGRRED